MNKRVAGMVRAAAKKALPLGLARPKRGNFIDGAQCSVSCFIVQYLWKYAGSLKSEKTVSARRAYFKRSPGPVTEWNGGNG